MSAREESRSVYTRLVSLLSFWVTIGSVAAGCSSQRQVAIVLTDSSSGQPIEAKFEINRVVDQYLWTWGPFGRSYERVYAQSSISGSLHHITVGDRDVLNVFAPGFEATRLQVSGRTVFVVRGESEILFQLVVDRAWVNRNAAEEYALTNEGVVSIPLKRTGCRSSKTAKETGADDSVAIGHVSHVNQDKLKALLNSNGISCDFEGSVAHQVFVRQPDADRARELAKTSGLLLQER